MHKKRADFRCLCYDPQLMRTSRYKTCLFVLPCMFLVSCQEPERPKRQLDQSTAPVAEIDDSAKELADAMARLTEVQERASLKERWLEVISARDKSEGAWATGDFLAKRNKIVINTTNVEEFSIDTSMVHIDWSRLVVIRIDGRNSELRKRDFAVYHFRVDDHGQWIILEP